MLRRRFRSLKIICADLQDNGRNLPNEISPIEVALCWSRMPFRELDTLFRRQMMLLRW